MRKVTTLATAVLIGLSLSACAPDSSQSPLTIQLQFGSYSTAQNSKPLWRLLGIKEANAAVTSLKMCFKRLRFKLADENTTSPETNEDNVDFAIGEVTISSSGASLGTVSVPPGTYKRIEFDLDSDCASGKSIQLTNGNGSFSTNQTITIKFSGTFTADTDGALTLGVQNILDQLNSYNGPDLKVAAESVSGELAN
ncbi:hypothetical protein QJS83_07535 [Bdellovibrio sp. 22V]|uniref:hypothetical protein n=1 Tax=Bdellovibrio TaxID=958 RepID=UPI002542B303|nr:hypothetical protein [Bdellovibrio sp. 22V]WII73726.1 hypothetical protein QJS83_07535 [Bdellovibrio sp. 22V]